MGVGRRARIRSGLCEGAAPRRCRSGLAFIDANKDRTDGGLRWGVETICTVLTEHGVKIAPSTYYEARHRAPSSREASDERLKAIIREEWGKRKILGARKLWLRLRRNGHDIARCTVERCVDALWRVWFRARTAGGSRGGCPIPRVLHRLSNWTNTLEPNAWPGEASR